MKPYLTLTLAIVALLAFGTAATAAASGDTISPAALKELLDAVKNLPVILHAGPPMLYRNGHIPGSIAVGQAGQPEGMASLQKELGKLKKNQSLIIYCGCCPKKDCPNIRPAMAMARKMGFASVRALDIATNFKTDWVDKGYPVEKK